VLVRHGPTEWSVSGRHTGRTDLPLTEAGRRQAELLRTPLAEYSFARVLTSPLSRAADTCRLAGFGDRAEPNPELVEWDYGEYEGLTTPGIREKRPGWLLWREGCPGGESAADVATRVDRVIAELREGDGDVALFAHGHVLRVLAVRWLDLGPEHGASLVLTTATISVMGWERELPAVWLWNDGSHLRPAA
jgi:broad specificity phosphatase PhoE